MNRPEFNRLQQGERVIVNVGEDSDNWVPGTIVGIKKARGVMVWIDVDPEDGKGLVRVEAGYIEAVRKP